MFAAVELAFSDWCAIALSGTCAVLGLFGGFSGFSASIAGTVAGSAAGMLAWKALAGVVAASWLRGAAALLAALLAFGIVRALVRKFVNGMLAQPADAIFGALAAGLVAFAASLAAMWGLDALGVVQCGSVLLEKVLSVV